MTTHHDETYLALLHHVLKNGVEREDRTGIGTKSIFGYQMRFDLGQCFPLLTTKSVFFAGVVDELLWFLSGSTNVNDLPKRSRQLWAPWAADDGDLGFIYGYQWRSWTDEDDHGYRGLDQIAALIRSIKASPCSRRHIVSAWNPAEVGAAALPPCHVLFQFYVNDGKLSCQLYQRSADVFLGVPFNIASYALLTHMIAQVTGLKVGEFIHTLGDAHLYLNHLDQARLQLSREPFHSPQIMLNQAVRDIDDFKFADIVLMNYHPQPAIKAPVAV